MGGRLDRWRRMADRFLPRVQVVTGVEAASGRPCRVAYAGDLSRHNRDWCVGTVFGRTQTEVERSLRIPVQRLRNTCRSRLGCGLLFARPTRASNSGRGPLPPGQVRFPVWIESHLDLTPEAFASRHGRHRKIAAKMRRNELAWSCDQVSPSIFDLFYERMYLPHARGQFDDSAFVWSRDVLERTLSQNPWKLVQVSQRGRFVAGLLVIYPAGSPPTLEILGVLDNDRDLVRAGATGALIYGAQESLRSEGHPVLVFGGSRPLLDDGSLHYKALYGARIVPRPPLPHQDVWLSVLDRAEPTLAYLCSHPFIGYDETGNGYRGYVFIRDGVVPEQAIGWSVRGLSSLVLVAVDGVLPERDGVPERIGSCPVTVDSRGLGNA